MSLNRVSLMGHIGKAPQFYQTDEGDAFARFALAPRKAGKTPRDKGKPAPSGTPLSCFPESSWIF